MTFRTIKEDVMNKLLFALFCLALSGCQTVAVSYCPHRHGQDEFRIEISNGR